MVKESKIKKPMIYNAKDSIYTVSLFGHKSL